MPVEIREIVIRAELSPRSLTSSSPNTQESLTPEMISMLQSICADEFQQISKELPNHVKNGKFER